jgi:hypothetical protein
MSRLKVNHHSLVRMEMVNSLVHPVMLKKNVKFLQMMLLNMVIKIEGQVENKIRFRNNAF